MGKGGSARKQERREYTCAECVCMHTCRRIRQKWTKVYFWVSLQQQPLSSVLRIISHLSGWVDKLPGSMA